MPSDYITLNALTREIGRALDKGRIDRVCQPENDELDFVIFASGKTRVLTLSANPAAPGIRLSERKKPNPYAAPPFCMLLRKHLTGAQIESVGLFPGDRVADIRMSGRSEMSDAVEYHLYCELIGRFCNVVLVKDGLVMDALKYLLPGEDKTRVLLPKLTYEPPLLTRPAPEDAAAVLAALKDCTGTAYDRVSSKIGGMSAATLREVFYRSNVSAGAEILTDKECGTFLQTLSDFCSAPLSPLYAPCYLKDKDGTPGDFFIMPYLSSPGNYETAQSLSDAAERVYIAKDGAVRLKDAAKASLAAVKNARQKSERALTMIRQKLLEAADADKYRKWGDAVLSNVYRLKKGDTALQAEDYESGGTLKISLDARFTPGQNAEALYKKYAKLKRTAEYSLKQEAENISYIEYLDSVKAAIDCAIAPSDFAEIEAELIKAGCLKEYRTAATKKKRKDEAPAYLTFNIDGYKVFCGKNNLQNDAVTFKLAKSDDMWLHTKNAPGAHVLIKAEGKKVPESVAAKAAEIAAAYSGKERHEIDITLRKYVKKHPSGKPGMVLYTDFKTVLASPDPHEELRCK